MPQGAHQASWDLESFWIFCFSRGTVVMNGVYLMGCQKASLFFPRLDWFNAMSKMIPSKNQKIALPHESHTRVISLVGSLHVGFFAAATRHCR